MSGEFFQEIVDKFIFRVKKGLLYTEDDIWTKIKDGEAFFGVTDFLQRRSGDVTFVELPKKGAMVRRGEEISSLETIKAVVALPSPLEGFIAEVNTGLNDRPELINEDPYGAAWIALISRSHPEEDQQSLLTAERYFELMKSKIKDEQKRSKKEA
jgi:glycine cleavage system H protein